MENQNNSNRKMKWQIDLDSYFNVYSTFILDGYIDDVQPHVIDGDPFVDYINIEEYFEQHYYDTPAANKKCVIIYDPTESSDKRFHICGPCNQQLVQTWRGRNLFQTARSSRVGTRLPGRT